MMAETTNSRIFTREQIANAAARESKLERAIAGSLEAIDKLVKECRPDRETE